MTPYDEQTRMLNGAVGSPSPSWARAAPAMIVGRLLRVAVVCALVVVITFVLVRLIPGDAVTAILGPRATETARRQLLEQLHLNGSWPQQFTAYAGSLLHGDLGTSLSVRAGSPVLSIIGSTLPVTLLLVSCAVVVSCLLGVPVGLLAAARGGAADTAVRVISIAALATPPFFFGLILILLLALRFPVLPAGGWSATGDAWRYLVLPVIALTGYLAPLVTRATRQSAGRGFREAWAEAALARGLSPARITFRHVLPNGLLPVVTLVGYNVGALLAGAVVVETVFGLPGIGQELVNAVNQRDYPVVQGIAIVSAIVVVLSNLAADLVSARLDPRIVGS